MLVLASSLGGGLFFTFSYFVDTVCYLSKDITDIYLPKSSVNSVVSVPTKLYLLVFISVTFGRGFAQMSGNPGLRGGLESCRGVLIRWVENWVGHFWEDPNV